VYHTGNKFAYVAALRRDCAPVKDVYRCNHTHIIPEEKTTKSSKYLTFVYMIMVDEHIENLVITFAAHIEKKTDMSNEEKIAFYQEVVRGYKTGEFVEMVLDLDYRYRIWRRYSSNSYRNFFSTGTNHFTDGKMG
jgi:hypothetical protein